MIQIEMVILDARVQCNKSFEKCFFLPSLKLCQTKISKKKSTTTTIKSHGEIFFLNLPKTWHALTIRLCRYLVYCMAADRNEMRKIIAEKLLSPLIFRIAF